MKTNAVSKSYEDKLVLDVPPLELLAGQIYAMVGANGSGKSTFSRILAGTENADGRSEPWQSKPVIGYMPQKTYAFRMSTIANMRVCGGAPEEINKYLEAMNMTGIAETRARKLSGGESAKMALGRVLTKQFELLLLDEPTAAMDMESTLTAERLIQEYCQKHNAAALIATHSLEQARRIADTILYLQEGKILEQGPAEQVLNHPQRAETRRFLEFYGVLPRLSEQE